MDARITLIAGALLMRLGLALYGSGSVRSKNAASFIGRHLLDWALALLVFWAIGLAIADQTHNPIASIDPRLLFGSAVPGQVATGLAMASILGAIVIGATAERSKLSLILTLSVVSSAIILPLGINWSRTGWLANLGFIDRGGAAAIHVAGAAIALVALKFIGPREGKYPKDGSSTVVPGHNVNLLLAGAWLAVAGGALFLCQDAADAANVLLATAASVLAAAAYCRLRYGKVDLTMLAASAIAGVVAISAVGGQSPEYGAFIIGVVAGLIVAFAIVHVDLVHRMDDVTGAISIHGAAGVWGVLAAGLFHLHRTHNVGHELLVQLIGVVAIGLLAIIVAAITMLLLSRISRLRTRPDDEFDGLDLAEHDVASYPDFQQNTIKSYHLREM